MKITTAALLAVTFGIASAASAQPSGGPDAKGNAPLKAPHTINDGVAKPGANSFTEGQAREHILNSGYSVVSSLNKGSDGVWRGVATKNGAPAHVALDFKGNVSEDTSVVSSSNSTLRASGAQVDDASAGAMAVHHHRHRRHRHHHHSGLVGEKMDGQGAAVSGVDRNDNGISDKEDRALKH